MSTLPQALRVWAIRASSDALSEILAETAIASPPAFLMAATTSSQAGSLRLETTTLAPASARFSQIERPMPLLPPVTTATLPFRSNSLICSPFDSCLPLLVAPYGGHPRRSRHPSGIPFGPPRPLQI